jgi:hypothetical protein
VSQQPRRRRKSCRIRFRALRGSSPWSGGDPFAFSRTSRRVPAGSKDIAHAAAISVTRSAGLARRPWWRWSSCRSPTARSRTRRRQVSIWSKGGLPIYIHAPSEQGRRHVASGGLPRVAQRSRIPEGRIQPHDVAIHVGLCEVGCGPREGRPPARPRALVRSEMPYGSTGASRWVWWRSDDADAVLCSCR